MATVTEIANMSSLETAQDLGKAGFDQKQAEALAKCFHDLSVHMSRQIAEQIAGLRAEMLKEFAAIREELAEHKKETDRKIEENRKETDRKIEENRKETDRKIEENRKDADRKTDEISKGMRNIIIAMTTLNLTGIGIMVALVIHLN